MLAGNLSSDVVDADPDMAGVDESAVGGGHGVGSSEVVDQSGVGLGVSLAVVPSSTGDRLVGSVDTRS